MYHAFMRPVTVDDADELAELEMQLFPDNCLNEHSLAREIDLGFGWVICEERRIVGYALCRGNRYLTDLIRLGVVKTHQREGRANRMLNAVVNCAQHVMLTVQPDNDNALRLYRRHDFEIVGRLKEGAWVMGRVNTALSGGRVHYFIGLDL